MIPLVLTVLSFSISTFKVIAQDTAPQTSSKPIVYDLGPEIIAPELIPALAPTAQGKQCEGTYRAKVQMNMKVDADGKPAYFYFIEPAGDDRDALALMIAAGNRFTPATRNGIRVPVRQSVEISFEACIGPGTNSDGKTVQVLRLKTQPVQRFGPFRKVRDPFSKSSKGSPNVHAPLPLLTPEAKLTRAAVSNHVNAACLVSLKIDEHGMPLNPQIVKAVGYGLDESAIRAVRNYRFVPAMRNEEPIPVKMSIAVAFKVN